MHPRPSPAGVLFCGRPRAAPAVVVPPCYNRFMPSPRHFPPPWDIEEANAACFIVKDNSGHALAYVYFEQEPGRRAAAKLLTRDEARRIAIQIAKLPDLMPPPR